MTGSLICNSPPKITFDTFQHTALQHLYITHVFVHMLQMFLQVFDSHFTFQFILAMPTHWLTFKRWKKVKTLWRESGKVTWLGKDHIQSKRFATHCSAHSGK